MRLKRSMSRTTAIAMLSASAVLALAGPASAAQVHGLHLTVPTFAFTGGVCVDTRCDVTADGTATSQLTGTGSMHYSLIVDFFDGFDAPCNHVDETGTYTFADGTITITSSHTDCWIVGLRIFTTFAVDRRHRPICWRHGAWRRAGRSRSPTADFVQRHHLVLIASSPRRPAPVRCWPSQEAR